LVQASLVGNSSPMSSQGRGSSLRFVTRMLTCYFSPGKDVVWLKTALILHVLQDVAIPQPAQPAQVAASAPP